MVHTLCPCRCLKIVIDLETGELTCRCCGLVLNTMRNDVKRRMWIRQGDIVLVSPWDFQSDKRGDIIWRYKRNQAGWLRSKGYLTI